MINEDMLCDCPFVKLGEESMDDECDFCPIMVRVEMTTNMKYIYKNEGLWDILQQSKNYLHGGKY
jgi:hypothetical protein